MKIPERHKAIQLRKKGLSLNEISAKLKVSKSSASYWVRDIVLSEKAQKVLTGKLKLGQIVAARNKLARTKAKELGYFNKSAQELKKIKIDKSLARLLCAAIYWCEGAKNPKSGVAFTNSDPYLVTTFLKLMRMAFEIDEKKFRPGLHLHSYHNPKQQLDFWSKITDINKQQFIKPYIKVNTGKRIHPDYPGCICIKYHSNDLARHLLALGRAFLNKGV